MNSIELKAPPGRDPDVVARQERNSKVETSYFVIRLDNSLYAFPSEHVEFIGATEQPTAVPTAPSHILGIFQTRGRILAVVDLGALLRLPGTDSKSKCELRRNRRLVALRTQMCPFAVFADEALGICQVDGSSIREMDKDGEWLDSTMEYIGGQFDYGDRIATILNLNVILSALSGISAPRGGY